MPEVIISGPEGRLEARYQPSTKKNAPAALILHPHPLHGGTMNNKVTYSMYHALHRNGFSVLRFNFRGVGKSQGTFDNGVGELSDAATALDWLQVHNPDAISFWVAGFSFGAWIAMQLLMRRPEIDGYIAASPPANKYDFSFLAPCPVPGLILQGDDDSIVDESSVAELASKLSNQKNAIEVEYHVLGGADHFFRNKIDKFNDHLDDYLQKRIKDMRRPKRIKPDRRRRQVPQE